METFSALLALCEGNPLVTGELPSQRPVAQSFGVFLDLRLNKRFNKQSIRRWYETPSHSSWRQSNGKMPHSRVVPHKPDSCEILRSFNITVRAHVRCGITGNSTVCSTACSNPQENRATGNVGELRVTCGFLLKTGGGGGGGGGSNASMPLCHRVIPWQSFPHCWSKCAENPLVRGFSRKEILMKIVW